MILERNKFFKKKAMKLNKIFDQEPLFAKELSVGIYYIPILKIKEMLWEDFERWGDKNFWYTITLRGHETIVSGRLDLEVIYEGVVYTFSGSATFSAESNQNWLPILNSECIKNAVKKIGRKYGMYLNQDLQESEELNNAPKPKPDTPEKKQSKKVEKGISEIIKLKSQ